MNHIYLIEDLGLMLVAASFMMLVTRRLKTPAIVNYLLAGLCIGPVLGWMHETSHLDLISETGIVLLLFLVGIELNIRHFKEAGKEVIWTGLWQMSLTCAVIFGLATVFQHSLQTSIILGLAFMFSSTVVVVKLLQEHRTMKAFHGRVSVGILLLQDVAALAAITLISSLGTTGEAQNASVLTIILTSLSGMALLIGFAWVASKFIVNPALNWSLPIPGMMFIWSLGWCFLFVAMAHMFGLSHEIGAFLAGLSLAQSRYSAELKRRVHPLMNFFVVIFFVVLGVETKFNLSVSMWAQVFALSACVMAFKCVIIVGVLWKLGRRKEGSLLAGLHLAQISEFSLILIALAGRQGLVSEEVQTMVAWTGISTIAISSYGVFFQKSLLRWIQSNSRLGALFHWTEKETEDNPIPMERDHAILVIGMNAMGRDIVKQLVASGENVTAIDSDPMKLQDLPCNTVHGNIHDWDLLEAAGFSNAKLIVSALQIEEANQLLAFRSHAAKIPCCVMAPDTFVMPALLELDVSYFMTPFADGIKRQRAELTERGLLEK
jgi:Kef-type K+ transport system membrane component KefB